jgi:hypothetical protein
MFSTLISFAALALAVSAAPTKRTDHISNFTPNHGVPTSLNHIAFNNWGGFNSLNRFDDFYGIDNFSGHHNNRVFVQKDLVCKEVDITIIQQQLSVVQEFAKRIVTQQICEVEVQTIVWSQFISGFSGFGQDIRRISGRPIGFDHKVASHIGNLVDDRGEFNNIDFGFNGIDIGSNLVGFGDNWVNGQSEFSVGNAFLQSSIAQLGSSNFGRFGSGGNFGGIVSVDGL